MIPIFSPAAACDAIGSYAESLAHALGPLARQAHWVVAAGSGLSALAELGTIEAEIPYSAIHGLGGMFPVADVAGHAGRWLLLRTPAGPVHCLAGRRHLYEGIEPALAAVLVRTAGRLGCRAAILTNAAGGLTAGLAPGDLMMIDDHLNLSMRNPLTGAHDARNGPRFVDMSAPWDADFQRGLLAAAAREGIVLKRGVYAALSGPCYETRAEARMLSQMGADAVGMSTVPEAIAARQAGMRLAGISLIANSHVKQESTTHEEVLEQARGAGKRLKRLIAGFLETQCLVPE